MLGSILKLVEIFTWYVFLIYFCGRKGNSLGCYSVDASLWLDVPCKNVIFWINCCLIINRAVPMRSIQNVFDISGLLTVWIHLAFHVCLRNIGCRVEMHFAISFIWQHEVCTEAASNRSLVWRTISHNAMFPSIAILSPFSPSRSIYISLLNNITIRFLSSRRRWTVSFRLGQPPSTKGTMSNMHWIGDRWTKEAVLVMWRFPRTCWLISQSIIFLGLSNDFVSTVNIKSVD